MLFSCFWAYVGQPHDHIGWATSMPFASINPTNPWNFHKKILRIGNFEKWPFWKSGHFEFFFASFSWKSVQIRMVEWMGRNFDVFPMRNITLYSVSMRIMPEMNKPRLHIGGLISENCSLWLKSPVIWHLYLEI